MPDDIVPSMPGSAEEELDFQKRFTWDGLAAGERYRQHKRNESDLHPRDGA